MASDGRKAAAEAATNVADDAAKSSGSERRRKKSTAIEQSTSQPVEKIGGYKYTFEDKLVFDYVKTATARNIWYYRDRLNVPRGPCSIPVLRECWVHGIVDENTLIWGQGLMDWLPVRNVRTLVPQIRTFEVQVATWIKRQFALKPALARIRQQRADQRHRKSDQVDSMY